MRTFISYHFLSLFIFALLLSCSSRSPEDFHDEGEGIVRALTAELKKIHSRDDLLLHTSKLQKLFNELADVIIAAQEYKDQHPNLELRAELHTMNKKEQQTSSDQLRIELNRILHMEGGRETLEKVQEEALNRLDAFEQSRSKKF